MSKRARLREKRRRERIRNRAVMISIVVGSALLLVFLFVIPSIKPIGEITLPEFRERPMVDGRAMGDPNAPVTIEVFTDFQLSRNPISPQGMCTTSSVITHSSTITLREKNPIRRQAPVCALPTRNDSGTTTIFCLRTGMGRIWAHSATGAC